VNRTTSLLGTFKIVLRVEQFAYSPWDARGMFYSKLCGSKHFFIQATKQHFLGLVTLKWHRMFSVQTASEKFKTPQSPVILEGLNILAF